jgi:very long chain acyl-CoA dehydrogenase
MSCGALLRIGRAVRATPVAGQRGWQALGLARPLSQGQRWRAYSTADAEETNNQSFVMNTFLGKMETAELFPFPEVMTEDEKQNLSMFIDPVTKFFEEVNDAARNDREEGMPAEIFEQLREMGAFGLQVPTELGGVGLTNTQYARMVEIVGGYDLGIGIVLGAHQSIGFKGILLYGTDEQKRKYLPRLSSGELVAAYCLTEPSSGSDASSIRTRAVKSEDGKHYILNGGKIWISNGGIAEVFTVFAQTPVTDPKTGETKDKISAFVVERGFGGVTSGPPEKKMGIKASNTAEVHFEDVKVPVENLLGEEGKGFYVAMNILNNGRFGMAGALSGTMKSLIRRTAEHVSTRVQFGNKLETYGVVQEKIAHMALRQYVTESIAYLLSGNMDRGSVEYQLEAAISKIYASESAWWVADECVQLHGGMGFMTECGLERVMRDLRIFRIFEGSNDILRLFISLTGLQYAGKQLREVEKSVKGMDFGVIMSEGLKRTRRLIGSSSAPSVAEHSHKDLSVQAEQLSQLVGDFGTTCEKLLLTHRKNIIHEQFLLQRLANAAIDIYGMAAVISRASKSLSGDVPTGGYERLLTATFCQQAFDRTNHTLQSITSSKEVKLDAAMSDIAKKVVEHGEVVPVHPLGL